MSTINVQLATTPLPSDLPCYNYGGSDIPANTVVCLDGTNTITNSVSTLATGLGVVLPTTGGNPSVGFGVTMEVIKAGQTGRVRTAGVALVTGDGAITAGTVVDVSVTTAGRVKAHTAGKYSFALALSTSADGEQLLINVLGAAPNA